MQEKIAEWLNHLRLDKSADTVRSYQSHLERLDRTAPERTAEEWTTTLLVAYIAGRRADGKSDAFIKQMVGAFRNFFGFACGPASPAKAIPYPRVHKRLQRVLSPEYILKLLASCKTETPTGVRDLAMIAIMLDTGLRASEVCRLRLVDLDLQSHSFKVVIKGGDEAGGIFSEPTARFIAHWLELRPKYADPACKTVFTAWRGSTPGQAMTRSGLRCNFRRIAQEAGLPLFSPHDLRRTFATLATRYGAPTRVLQAAGRWADVSMIERYTATINPDDFAPYLPMKMLLQTPTNKA